MKTTKIVLFVLLSLVVLTISGFAMRSCGIFKNHAYKSMENAVISYDEYQDIYANLLKEVPKSAEQDLLEPEPNLPVNVQQLFEQFKHLSEEQKTELKRLMQSGDDQTSHKFLL